MMSLERLSQLCEKYPQAAKLEVQNLLKGSLYAVARNLCGYQEIHWNDLGEIIQCLESPTKRKMIVIPRGCFKTSIGSVAFPIWLLINNPNLRIMLDSELYTGSTMRVREIRGHFESERFKKIFGDWKGSTWTDGELIVGTRTKVLKEPSIFASGIGVGRTGSHCNVIIADDLNSPLNTNNSDNAAKVIDHVRMYESILEPGGTIVFIGTRYSSSDIFSFILRDIIGKEKLPKELRHYAE